MKTNLVVLFALSLLVSGCAGGHSYDYRVVPVFVPHLSGHNEKVAVGVHDQRKYVKNKDKYPQYVGTMRSPAYVPWNVNTKSGAGMADDFAVSIKKTLEASQFKVDVVSLSPQDGRQQAIAKLERTGDNKQLLFTIHEWYFDIWGKVRMEYDLQLDVLDRDGIVLATARTGKKMWKDTDNANPAYEFRKAIESLLGKEKIVTALDPTYIMKKQPEAISEKNQEKKTHTDTPANVAQKKADHDRKAVKAAAFPCTTEQILKMKAMGMADSQIKAACQ